MKASWQRHLKNTDYAAQHPDPRPAWMSSALLRYRGREVLDPQPGDRHAPASVRDSLASLLGERITAGTWDETCVDFSIDLSALSEGWHTVETKAVAILCELDDPEVCDPPREREEETYASVDFYVNTDCADDAFEQNDRVGQTPAIPAGLLPGLQICAFDTDRYGVWLRKGAAIGMHGSAAARLSRSLGA